MALPRRPSLPVTQRDRECEKGTPVFQLLWPRGGQITAAYSSIAKMGVTQPHLDVGLGAGELGPWEEAAFQQRLSRTAGLFGGQLTTSALPPKAQGLQMPCPCPIFTGSPKPINISSRILYSRNSATEHECHSFVLLGC